jgi:hypothetical protein
MDKTVSTILKLFASHMMVLCANKILATQEIKDLTAGLTII